MKPGLVLVTAFFAACASPDAGTTIGTGTAKGPDLGGFVVQGDLGVPLAHSDFATEDDMSAVLDASVPDLATATAHDMATAVVHDMAMASGCGSVTYAGSCSGNTLTYCYQNAVQTLACTGGTKCTTVAGDSDCRYVNGSACGSVDSDGLCDGDTLVYCDGSTLSVTDCSASGLSCDDSFGFADCD
jgi:hypothetical protein